MLLTDYLTEFALHVDSHCLRIVSEAGAELGPAEVHQLRVGCKRLRAMWRTFKPVLAAPETGTDARSPPDTANEYQRHIARLRITSRLLGVARDREVIAQTIDRLVRRCGPDREQGLGGRKTAAALTELRDALDHQPPAAFVSKDEISVLLQAESRAWRDIRVRPTSNRDFVDSGFGSVYARARHLGALALASDDPELIHRFRRWCKMGLYQLDALKPCLGSEHQALCWNLRKLGDTLGRYQDMELVWSLVGEVEPGPRRQRRIARVLAAEQAALMNKAQKLFDRSYGPKPKAFTRLLAKEVEGFGAGDVILLPPLSVARS